jgi:hypothetical protein
VKIFVHMGKMNSTLRYIPFRSTQEGRYDLSPFRVRTEADQDVPERKVPLKKGVKIIEPSAGQLAPATSSPAADDSISIKSGTPSKRISIQRWLQPHNEKVEPSSPLSIMKETIPNDPGRLRDLNLSNDSKEKKKLTPLDKSKAAQWTFTQVVHESLNPSVSQPEADDYARYISHPQTLPLVVSTEIPAEIEAEYLDYVNGSWLDIGVVTSQDGLGDDEGMSLRGLEEIAEYRDFVSIATSENPLMVLEEDGVKKRYKAYRKWLLGKSLFKQQPVD